MPRGESWFFGDSIHLSDGRPIPVDAYRTLTNERAVPHSTARHSLADGEPYMVGALPRLTLNGDRITGGARDVWAHLGPTVPCRNVIMNDVAQLVELVFSVEQALRMVEEMLETISKQALRCREIVKGLLDFSHQSDVRVTRTDVNAIIDGAVLLLRRQAVFHNVSIERTFDRDAPRVLINPGQLQDAVTNLLVNAVDAMENGGTVTVETAAMPAAGEVLIRVADTGCGIPEKNLPYLFEPFFTTKKVGKGTGLGLAIVHGIVTGARGSIEVSTGPSGTRFTIHLPGAPAGTEGDGSSELAGAGAGESAGGR